MIHCGCIGSPSWPAFWEVVKNDLKTGVASPRGRAACGPSGDTKLSDWQTYGTLETLHWCTKGTVADLVNTIKTTLNLLLTKILFCMTLSLRSPSDSFFYKTALATFKAHVQRIQQ